MVNFLIKFFSSLFFINSAFAEFGEHLKGIYDTHSEKGIALTFDLCGGKNGNNFDKKLFDYLKDNKIKATIFLNGRFLKKNKELIKEISKYSNFDIQNHGLKHRPASITGKSIYGINGFKDEKSFIKDFEDNKKLIFDITGKKTKFYRSGTAYYETKALEILKERGYKAIGFSINGDDGATLKSELIEKRFSKAKDGDIIINHLNHPEKNINIGIIKGISKLQKQGFRFVFIKDVIN